MSFEVTVTPTVYNVEVEVNPSVQPFDVQVITQQDLADLVDEAKQYAEDAEDSADSASASASSASASATTATNQANIATNQALLASAARLNAQNAANAAEDSADDSALSASSALASATSAELDAIATAADRVQTGLDRVATGADRVQTGLDRVATGADRVQTGIDANTASASASTATAQAGIATTQAGIATTQAGNALTSANNALNSANAAAASASSASQTGTSTLLTGFTTGANTTILGTDTILGAFQKAQGQINARVSGTGVDGQVAFWSGTGSQTGSGNLIFDSVASTLTISNLRIRNADAFVSENACNIYHTVLGAGPIPFTQNGNLVLTPRSNSTNRHVFIATFNGIAIDWRWSFRDSGALLSNGAQTIQTSAGALTLQTGNQNVLINTTTDSGFRLDVNGTARVQGALTTNLTAGRVPFIGTGGVLIDSSDFQWSSVNSRITSKNGYAIRSISDNSIGGLFIAINTIDNELRTARGTQSFIQLIAGGSINFGYGASTISWTMGSDGILQSNGAQTIRTSTGNLTLATGGGNGNIFITPNGTGQVIIGNTDINTQYALLGATIGRRLVFENFINNSRNNAGHRINASDTSGALSLATVGTDRLFIQSNGNIGINTTTDAGFRLDVNGAARVQGALTVTTGGASITGLSTIQGTTASDSGQLGSELLTTGTGDASWTGSSFATGYTHVAGSTTTLTSTLAGVVNNFYQITYTVTGRTAGSFTIAFGGFTSGALTATGAVGPRATTTDTLVITPTSDFNGTIVLSIRVITVSSASVTFDNSAGTATNQIRISSISSNTFYGRDAARNNTTGANNTANGFSALRDNTTGFNNTANGVSALLSNTTGLNNTANGRSALQNNTTGLNNTANGESALLSNTTGNSNTANGFEAGRFIASGSALTLINNSVFLGAQSRANADNETNQIVIGHTAIGAGSNTATLGNTSIVDTILRGRINLQQYATGSRPAYVKGALIYDSTLGKLVVGGATGWEVVTSS
jgi:hypothetical protein